MRDKNGKCVEVIPTYYPCEYCLKTTRKKLFHPKSMCFNMKDKQGDKKDTD